MNQTSLHVHPRRPGFSLIDTVISLSIVAMLIVVFGSLVNVRAVNRRTLFRVQAAAIVNEEISALKRFDIGALGNQTNGPFLGMLYNAGRWNVVPDASAGHSGPNSIELQKALGFTNAVSGRLQWPAGAYGDATFQFAVKFSSDTAAGTAAGLFFRASDGQNGYRLLVAPTGTSLDGSGHNWLLERVVNGSAVTPRILAANVNGITTNTWSKIKVVATSTSLKTYLNGNGQDSGLLTDSAFTDGPAALIGWNGVHAFFDDAQTVVGTIPATWNFDGATTLPIAWLRFGLNDLPDDTGTIFDDNGFLTLSAYPNTNSTNLKQATLRVNWSASGMAGNYTTTILLGSSKVGQ